ncbi:MAG: two-component system, chemotaxis family, sensor kinase CheA [Betaproteobacteria bacterium]|nr:two-component system, chemotaxis family, sensor kinase CheA [Betaproteobacteria bacterium]
MSMTVPSADLLSNHASEALLAVDPVTLKVVRANATAAGWLGYEDGLHGRAVTDIDVSLAGAVFWNEACAGVRENLDRVETQYRRGDGSLVDVVQSVFAVQEDGSDYFVVRASGAKRPSLSDQAAADYATQLRTILEATAEGIMVLDTAQEVVSINHRLAALWSLPGEAIAGGDSAQILTLMGAQLPVAADAPSCLHALLSGAYRQMSQVITLRNGRTLEKRAQPHLVDGRSLGTILTFIDVTDRVHAELSLKSDRDYLVDLVSRQIADLRRARDEAEQANLAKSKFLATISHELRTPMHAILSFSGFGERGYASSPPEQIRRYFSRISQAGGQLLGLIDDLLDLSKSRAGRLSVAREMQDIRPVIDKVVQEMSALADGKQLGLGWRFEHEPSMAAIDAIRLGQVVRNLLSNAIKFTPSGGAVELRLSRETDGAGQPWHRLDVGDNGSGIPEDELELIFEQFEQGKGAGLVSGGTGLGLAIARELARAHGGDISAANNPGGGAIFTLLLPAQAAAGERPGARDLLIRA